MNKLSLKQFRKLNVEVSVRMESMFFGGSNHAFIPELKKIKLFSVEDYYSVLVVAYITAA